MSVESAVANTSAEVMLYNEPKKKWIAPDGCDGVARNIQILQNSERRTFRLIAIGQDGQLIVNCNIHHRLKYHNATPTFHQWRDEHKQVYGLNFHSEVDARSFDAVVIQILEHLNHQMMAGDYQVPEPCGPVYQDPQQMNGMVNGINGMQMNGGLHHIQSAPSFHHQEDNQQMQFRKSSHALPNQQMMSIGGNRRASQGSSVSSAGSIPGNVYAQATGASPSRTAPPAPPLQQDPPVAPAVNGIPPAPTLPPVSGGPPPPPPPPPLPSSNTAKPASLADQIKAASLKKSIGAPSKENRSMSVADATSNERSSASAPTPAGHSSLLSELAATINRRKNTRAAQDAIDSKSNISNGSSDSGCGTMPPPAVNTTATVPVKKWEPVKTNGHAESPKTHRKVPSGSSISSQEDRPVANGLTNGHTVSKDTAVTPEFLERFRTELLGEFQKEINKAKQEIIDALRQELTKK